MRPRVIMVLAIVTIVLGGVLLVPAAYGRFTGSDGPLGLQLPGSRPSPPPPPPTEPPPPTLTKAPVAVDFKGEFFSWALLDRQTGEITGATNMTATNSTESMIKIWFAADYLRQLGDRPLPEERKKQVSTAIRDSNDDAANALYAAVGKGASIRRMIRTCGLTDTKPGTVPGYVGWWSFTRMSPRDAVRLGDCVADGTAAGPKWTQFVLDEMAHVRGSVKQQKLRSGGGRWGIIDGLPASIISQGLVGMKNGWTPLNYDGNWHVNCLAVSERWSVVVMLRYPQKNGLEYGAQTCAAVTSQLVTPQPGAALKIPKPLGRA